MNGITADFSCFILAIGLLDDFVARNLICDKIKRIRKDEFMKQIKKKNRRPRACRWH